jgi:hypothetical protein
VVRIPRCGRGDLGSNPSSHIVSIFFLSLQLVLRLLLFSQVCALLSFDVVILKWNASQPLVDANQEQQAMSTTQTC